MIAKSDLIILAISAIALGLGLYRWQQNTAVPSSASLSAPSAPVSSTAATSGTPDPTSSGSDTAPRPAEPRNEPLVGRPASESSAPATTDDAATAPGSAGRNIDGTNASGRGDGAVAARVPSTDAGPSTTPSTAGTPPDAPLDTPSGQAQPSAGAGPLTPTSSEADASEPYGRYRVSEGDYLGRIAERFGTSVATLRSINGIEGNLILVGQELRYPLPAN